MARKTVKEISKEEAFALADEVAREIVANRALAAERDQHIQDVQDKYNPLIEANDKAIDAKIALVAMFAKSNRAEYFADKKSCETPLAILSFRYGNPTLKTLSSLMKSRAKVWYSPPSAAIWVTASVIPN